MSSYMLMETLKPFHCTTCTKRYETFDTYKTHCRSHRKWQRSSSSITILGRRPAKKPVNILGTSKRYGCKVAHSKERITRHLSNGHNFVTTNKKKPKPKRLAVKKTKPEKHRLHHDDIVEIPFSTQDASPGIIVSSNDGEPAYTSVKNGLSNPAVERNSQPEKDTNCVCTVCGKSYQWPHQRRRHERESHKINRQWYKCKVCCKEFTTKRSLDVHSRLHTDERPHRCTICLKSFNQSVQLRHHMNYHTGDAKYACKFCEKKFGRKANWVRHEIEMHMKNVDRDKEAEMMKRYGPIKVHGCKFCGKTFVQKAHLTLHVNSHLGVKPHECQTCNKCFVHKSNLTEHIRIHNNVKPYQCTYCSKSFRFQNNLTVHKRMHLEEKPFQCEFCQKTFRQTAGYKNHLRTHTGEKPYRCEICFHRFAQSGGYHIHLRTHTGEKPYKCEFCDYRAAQSSLLKSHLRVHTDARPF